MFWFVLYLFLALQVAACVIAVVARTWTLTPEPIVWRGTNVDMAANNVQLFLIDIDDSRFAYPTGMFVPDGSADLSAGRVVMREVDFQGSRGINWALRVFFTFHEVWRRQMARSGSLVVLFFWPFWMGLAAFLAAPFLITAILDIGYRRAFCSRIEAAITKHPGLGDAVSIRLQFRGLSAFGLVSDVLGGMTAPSRPRGLTTAGAQAPALADDAPISAVGERAAAWARSAEQRFRVIYGSGVGAAVLVALVLALVVHHGPAAASSSYGYDPATSSPPAQDATANESVQPDQSSSSGATAPGDVAPPPPTAPDDVAPPPPPRDSRASGTSPSAVLRRHFERLNAGDYDGAFELLSSRYRADNPNWAAQPSRAKPVLNVAEVGPATFGRGTARVPIKFYGRDRVDTGRSDTQCRRFEGDARMVREGRAWRYDPGDGFNITTLPSSLAVCNP